MGLDPGAETQDRRPRYGSPESGLPGRGRPGWLGHSPLWVRPTSCCALCGPTGTLSRCLSSVATKWAGFCLFRVSWPRLSCRSLPQPDGARCVWMNRSLGLHPVTSSKTLTQAPLATRQSHPLALAHSGPLLKCPPCNPRKGSSGKLALLSPAWSEILWFFYFVSLGDLGEQEPHLD